MTKLIGLYQRMYELTVPKCKSCRVPLSCCDPLASESSRLWAKEKYGIELKPLPKSQQIKENVPFLGEQGCVVAPYLRPNCTLHTCAINSLGFDKDLEWTEKYFYLRNKITEKEASKS